MEPVQVIAPDLVLVDWGPMTLTISAWAGGEPRPVMAAQAARTALESLSALADFRKYLSRPSAELDPTKKLPPVVRRALLGARGVSGELTPLAAVAGAAADQTADAALDLGADRVLVNNGGDIALRLERGQSAVVGLRPPGDEDALLARLRVEAGDRVGGAASSGWQGRSHSPGAADLVTVWSRDAARADAAATWLAGRVDVRSPAVKRRPARELNPESDLGETEVVVEVGELTGPERSAALAAGRAAATRLYEHGIIQGCLILVQGEPAVLDPAGRLEIDSWDRLRRLP